MRYGVHVIENQGLGMLETRFFSRKGELLQLPKAEEPVLDEKAPQESRPTDKSQSVKASDSSKPAKA